MDRNKSSTHIAYGSKPPKSFLEESDFSYMSSWFVRIKNCDREDISPPHYSKDTMELLLCNSVSGVVTIAQKQHELSKDQNYAFVIPAGTVHSTYFHEGGGTVYILKLSFSFINGMINFQNIFRLLNFQPENLIFSAPNYEQLIPDICTLIEHEDSPLIYCQALLAIMQTLYSSLHYTDSRRDMDALQSSADLKKVISWTNSNYADSISIDTVSNLIGMSKSYFCTWFKNKTKLTYVQYLNQVRVSNASRYLLLGETNERTAYACGFTNCSYFIKVFKNIEGCTPQEFKQRYCNK